MKFIRRLYDWTLSWAEKPQGPVALFVIAFVESSCFPIPPDVLLIALCLGRPRRALVFAAVCTAGSILGGMFGYFIGWSLFEAVGRPILEFYHAMRHFDYLVAAYEKNAFWIVFSAAFTPIPYKAITISAGVAKIPFAPFVLASLLGRAGRFFLVSGLIMVMGQKVKTFIEKYFEALTIVFTLLLVGGFLILKKAF